MVCNSDLYSSRATDGIMTDGCLQNNEKTFKLCLDKNVNFDHYFNKQYKGRPKSFRSKVIHSRLGMLIMQNGIEH